MNDPEAVLSRPAAAPPRTLRYADDDTGVIDVWDTEGATATVALVHGGFWKAAYDRIHLRPLANALASQGFSIASIEYPRLGMPGGGWPGTFESVCAALRSIQSDERLGTHPLIAVGHSAGGHLVTLAASDGGVDGLAGIVPLAGVLDLAMADGLGLGDGAARAFIGHDRSADDEDWRAADPARRRLRAPAVLLHGSADPEVPIGLSQAHLATDFPGGARARLVEFPDLGHYELIDPEHPAFDHLVAAIESLART